MLLAAIFVFGLIAQKATIGQFRVDMRAPVNVTPMGGVSTVHYGGQNVFRPRTRYLPSENRYLKSAWGLLPSQNRYLDRAWGPLPSEGRTAGLQRYYPQTGGGQSLAMQTQKTLGSIRYHKQPVHSISNNRISVSSQQKGMMPSSLSMPGSIKYGLSGVNLTGRQTTKFTDYTRPAGKKIGGPSPLSNSGGVSSRSYRMSSPAYLNGSLRYSDPSR